MKPHCYFARFVDSKCVFRADGAPDRAHMIPQTRLKKEYKSRGFLPQAVALAIWDHRLIVPACRHHHIAFDSKSLRLPLDDYPLATREYANDYGWFFQDERTGWLPEREDAAA